MRVGKLAQGLLLPAVALAEGVRCNPCLRKKGADQCWSLPSIHAAAIGSVSGGCVSSLGRSPEDGARRAPT
eukprot:900193-Alexandrium_andersonii.AAC.1